NRGGDARAKPGRRKRPYAGVEAELENNRGGEPGRRKRPLPAPHNPRPYADFTAVFEDPIFRGCIGLELINRLDAFASEALDLPIENVFSRHSPFWTFCRNIFQEWYL